MSLGRTGSWRAWSYNSTEDRWLRELGISGHVRAVKDIAWSNDGTQLMSTSTDQTTRLFGQWKRDNTSTWHEMSRPQIHGYDLNCLSAIGATQFISGADEKLLRVFNKPKAVAHLLAKLSGSTEDASDADLPDAANIPVLGLSNKAINALTPEEEATAEPTEETQITKSTLDLSHPPFEDHLARHTLFPELEKLYGHGYEISCVAASHDGSLVATACRASSIDHAVIRLYETKEWREVKPALTAHSLTVTSLAFSADDNYLLSVGRDRQWALFSRSATASSSYELTASNPKGHSRMILSCSWAGAIASNVFATGGRDKNVKIWGVQVSETTIADLHLTIPTSAPATSVAFYTGALCSPAAVVLAAGTENGEISVWCISTEDWSVKAEVNIGKDMQPSGAINALRWRPDGKTEEGEHKMQLAVASEDLSVRLFELQGLMQGA